nr:MAG TPA: hypothetical protein [Caudoviricetes sp.]
MLYLQVYKKCATFVVDKGKISITDVRKSPFIFFDLLQQKHICQVLQTKQNVINFCLRLYFDVSSTTILINY